MRVLIGCEESQTVCKAFRNRGHKAFSCDIQPTRGDKRFHIQGDIIEYLESLPDKYLDLIILHPDCTKMAVCNNALCAKGKPQHADRLADIAWTMELWKLAKRKGKSVALENPASTIFPHLRKDGAVIQYIQPWQFGHMEQKKTGLALHNLDELEETNNVYKEMMKLPKKDRERIHYMSPGPNRKRDRSKTFQGIADAMAEQWGEL